MYPTPFTLFVGFALLITPAYTFQISTSVPSPLRYIVRATSARASGRTKGDEGEWSPEGRRTTFRARADIRTCEKTEMENFEQCEYTDDNFNIIDACFNCQAEASGTDQLQDILSNIVFECNNQVFAVTGTIAPQTIVASTFALAGNTEDPAITTSNSVFKSTGGTSATSGSSDPSSARGGSSSSNNASRAKKELSSLAIWGGEQRSGDRDMPVAFFSGNGVYCDRDCCLPKQQVICIYLCGPVERTSGHIILKGNCGRVGQPAPPLGNAMGSPLP
ncbi:hypothetical protein K438DRAFT_1775220 [Mycena galopus ATCC 62051]|nr:hypothetical protein K438DRAFT_1775220 [Mycena galopus ATCC 62051]